MKIELSRYLSDESVGIDDLKKQVDKLSAFDLSLLFDDDLKKAFWVNVYNGLTNYFIMVHELKKSVWEVANFFSKLKVNVGGDDFSLDDIEHGILRRNGERKKDKPLQFQPGDAKLKLMVNQFDPRIHFALNCGSISCPPIAFYSAENIDEELRVAEESFASQEFMVDPSKHKIRCSEIFIWYRSDFSGTYLNSPEWLGHSIEPIPYRWTIH